MNKDLKDLVIARLDNLPRGIKISIGSAGSLTKDELIKNVEKETPIGEKIAQIQLAYIHSFIKD
jgi:hypothetical protein